MVINRGALNNQEYEPEDISAEILKTVVKNAQEYQQQKGGLTGEIFEAVITVPAYFNDKQRHATKIAATRAGLNCLSLLPEPTAAAISYGFQPDSSEVKTILVYDLGGGTFDASVITVAGDSFIELGKAGDLWLGGDDIDDLITDFVKYQVESSEEIDDIDQLIQNLPLHQRLRFIADLKAAAEEAKILLSTKDSARVISSTPLLDEMGMMIPIDVEITRDQLDKLLLPLVEKSIKVCQDAISLSEYENELIDAVLLVGGSSQIPLIKRKLSEVFGDKKVFLHPEPMYAVAQGAAIVAAGHVEKVGTVSRDYFIELANNPRYKLISQGDILPVHKCYTFGLESDNQRLIHFKFYNKDNVRDVDELVGQMWLSLDRPYPRGTEILVSMELDEQSKLMCI